MATNLADLFDGDLLAQMLEEGLVKSTAHPDRPLVIYNYTARAQFANEWNDVTRACRGLIVHFDGTVVARPFPKFFNWDQQSAPRIPTGAVRVGAKMDGSLGILYADSIATRGSFTSGQALEATKIYREISQAVGFRQLFGRTYLFEIIYPANRIVVDYGDREALVLLDVLDNATGKSDLAAFDNAEWPDKVEWNVLPGFRHDLVETIPDGDEGLVFYWHGGPNPETRVKMKAAEYVRLHRIITGTSTKTVWEYLSTGRSIEGLLEDVPDEFYDWVRVTADEMNDQAAVLSAMVTEEYGAIIANIDLSRLPAVDAPNYRHEFRRLFAELACKSAYSDCLFAHYDARPFNQMVWKRLKPTFARPFTNQTEDVA